MNTAYFSNQFASASGHGIAHYAHRLYEGLRNHADLNVIPVATWSDRGAEELGRLQQETGLTLLPWGRKLTPLAWTYLNAPPIERWLDVPVDLTHIVSLGFPVATRKKLVVTVHDIGPITHTEYFPDRPWLFKRSFDHMTRYADAIICVSQATADEVAGYAGESISKRIHVIHEGVAADFFGKKSDIPTSDLRPPTYGINDAPYFLAAGALSPRKNIMRVLQAFQKIKDVIPHHLVLVGGGGWDSDEIFQWLEHSDLASRIHHLGYVSDDQLQALYKGADFYVHPSLFEGFGLTVLEAMAAGCPVITSNATSLPEVAGDAAVLVEPTSIDEIGEAMRGFALDAALRNEYRTRGLERVKRFQWSETANRVADLYRAL